MKSIVVGDRCRIRDGARLEVVNRPGEPGGRLIIGDGVSMEQGAHIVACGEIVLGDNVCFAPRCTVVDATHPATNDYEGSRAGRIASGRAFVHIESRVFLGANVVVLPNVTIGRNSVIGANSVVTHDIPANSIAAGAPARVIRQISED